MCIDYVSNGIESNSCEIVVFEKYHFVHITAYYVYRQNLHKYACEKPKIHKNMQLCANICKRKGEKSRIKEASAEAIGASADEVSYRVTSGTALRDFFGVLT